jgi:hypothetical protein
MAAVLRFRQGPCQFGHDDVSWPDLIRPSRFNWQCLAPFIEIAGSSPAMTTWGNVPAMRLHPSHCHKRKVCASNGRELLFTNERSKGGEAPKGAYHPAAPPQTSLRSLRKPSAGAARPQRRTLAFRRFTAALVPAVYRRKLSPGRASRDALRRRYRRIFHRA